MALQYVTDLSCFNSAIMNQAEQVLTERNIAGQLLLKNLLISKDSTIIVNNICELIC